MKKAFIAVLIVLVAATGWNASAQRKKTVTASKPYVSRKIHDIPAFDGIKLTTIADVNYTQSTDGTTSVTVSGAENALQYLNVEVKSGTLHIDMENKVQVRGEHKLLVTVSNPGIERVNSSGTGDIDIRGTLNVKSLEMHTSGTGDIDFDRIVARGNVSLSGSGTGDIEGVGLEARDLRIKTSGTGDLDVAGISAKRVEASSSGTGDLELSGKTASLKCRTSGTGDIEAFGLKSDKTEASASGTGSIECYAAESLSASASGTGGVRYSGNPGTVNITGGGKKVQPAGK